jgi:hypothetical protein
MGADALSGFKSAMTTNIGGTIDPKTGKPVGGTTGAGLLAGGLNGAMAKQQQQPTAAPVSFAMPNQPYIPPPQMGGMSNQFYGG